MDKSDQQLDRLFAQARERAPETPFSRTEKRFLTAVGAGLLASFLYWVTHSFTTKTWIIMTSSIGIVATTATLIVQTGMLGQQPIAAQETAPVEIEVTGTNYPQLEHERETIPLTVHEPIEVLEMAPSSVVQEIVVEPVAPVVEEVPVPEAPEVEPDTVTATATTVTSVLPTTPVVVPRPYASPAPAVPEGERVHYTVTEETTDEELQKISETARRAGVEFTYKARVKGEKMRKLDIKMSIPGTQNTSNIMAKGTRFTVEFGWLLNDNGTATSFLSNSTRVESGKSGPY